MPFQTASILSTKIYLPRKRAQAVPRPRLHARLNDGLSRKLTLISAPAGFGKTMLVSEWLANIQIPAAWLSLDAGDKDPTRFLTYVVAALQSAEPFANSLSDVLELLQSPQPLPAESILTILINELSAVETEFILVLDDYHLVDSGQVDEGLLFLIENMPPQMHLIITTREDPSLPLARYRVKGALTEIRVADLRFTPAEATDFFKEMGLTLSAAEVDALDSRTEGWIAGLQLAAISMQSHPDLSEFIGAFSGSHHFIVDYLIQEVLLGQPEHVRRFLLQTSILKNLNGALCDTVTGQENGRKMLESLDHDNLFTISLDGQRQWYRYHHLFADVLQTRLMEEQPEQIPSLHLRASHWFEQNDRPLDAIRHALAAQDFNHAANLVEQIWPILHRSNIQTPALLDLLKAIPNEFIRNRPVLCTGFAWSLLNAGELEVADGWLHQAESWINRSNSDAADMIVADEEEFKFLPAEIASARAYQTLAFGDLEKTIKFAEEGLRLLPESKFIRRGVLGAILGIVYWAKSEFEVAHQALADSMKSFENAGNIIFALSGTYGLADIRLAQGKLQAATADYEETLQLALSHQTGHHALQGTADIYLGLAGILLEQGDRDGALRHLQKSETLGQPAALPDWPYRLLRFKTRLKKAEGAYDEALTFLDEAEKLYVPTPLPNTRPIGAERARIWLAQGNLSKARKWAQRNNLTINDPPAYLHEFEQITLARLLIAEAKQNPANAQLESVLGWLERLQKAAEAGERVGSVIEILLLRAVVYLEQNKPAEADQILYQALLLAEPEGFIQLFVAEANTIQPSLSALNSKNVLSDIGASYLQRLMATLKTDSPAESQGSPLDDPLSERELDVLNLLSTELTGPEIADKLMVSLNTMRTHTKNIYSKLGVNSRRAAVRRAEELNLL